MVGGRHLVGYLDAVATEDRLGELSEREATFEDVPTAAWARSRVWIAAGLCPAPRLSCSATSPSLRPAPWSTSACPAWMASPRSEEHTSELQSLMRISYAVFCLKK